MSIYFSSTHDHSRLGILVDWSTALCRLTKPRAELSAHHRSLAEEVQGNTRRFPQFICIFFLLNRFVLGHGIHDNDHFGYYSAKSKFGLCCGLGILNKYYKMAVRTFGSLQCWIFARDQWICFWIIKTRRTVIMVPTPASHSLLGRVETVFRPSRSTWITILEVDAGRVQA